MWKISNQGLQWTSSNIPKLKAGGLQAKGETTGPTGRTAQPWEVHKVPGSPSPMATAVFNPHLHFYTVD